MPALDERDPRLTGYPVPVTLDGERVLEFLLVPRAGACSQPLQRCDRRRHGASGGGQDRMNQRSPSRS